MKARTRILGTVLAAGLGLGGAIAVDAAAPAVAEAQRAEITIGGREGFRARIRFGRRAPVAPPPIRYEAPPPPPRQAMVWQDGYWAYDGRQYVWVEGRWAAARPGYAWRASRWEDRRGYWELRPGTWYRAPPPATVVHVRGDRDRGRDRGWERGDRGRDRRWERGDRGRDRDRRWERGAHRRDRDDRDRDRRDRDRRGRGRGERGHRR